MMSFPVSVPYVFGSMSGIIPSPDLDANFSPIVNALNGINNGSYPLTSVSVTGGTWQGSPIGVSYGGSGLSSIPTNGQIDIGNGTGFTRTTITAGSGISVTNGSGSITISNTGPTGTVTSINVSGGTTGLTTNGGPVTSSGTITIGGTLGVSNGGTGVTTSTGSGSVVLSTSPVLVTPNLGTPSAATLTNATGLPITGISATGTPSNTTYLRGDGSWATVASNPGTVTSVAFSGGTTGLSTTGGPVTSAGTFTLNGTLIVANGGTGATTSSAARTNLGAAASGANTDITSIALTSGTVTNSPILTTDIANKNYVDASIAGLTSQVACQYATTADLGALTYNNGTSGVGATLTKIAPFSVLSVDGSTPSVGQRILVKSQTTQSQNGAYVVTSIGSGSSGWVLTRATDYDQTTEINAGDAFYIVSGSSLFNTTWVQQTPSPITIGTTSIVFIQFGGSATSGIKQPYSANGAVYANSASTLITGTLPTSGGGTGLTTFLAANNAIYSTSSSTLTAGTLPIAAGGTGLTSTPSNGQIDIGNGTGFTRTTITAGSGITITNAAGSITIASSVGGTVTSVGVSGGTTGLTTTGGPVTTSGTITLSGTLAIANGGTGATTASAALTALGGCSTGKAIAMALVFGG